MILKDIIKTSISLDEDICIRAGGNQRKNEIFGGPISDIPKEYENATIRSWKITRATPTDNYYVLAVEIDSGFADKVKKESYRKVKKLIIKESLPKPNVDWNKLNGASEENKRKFSKTYRLIKDYNLGDVNSIYTYNIEDTYLADKIENDGLWVNEDNEVVIPAGTEFTFWFNSDKTDGRDLYIYFLNVPELERDPKQYWIDRYYISDDDEYAFEILDYAKPI